MKFQLSLRLSENYSLYELKNDPSLSLLYPDDEFREIILKKSELNPIEFIKYIYFNHKSIIDNLFDSEETICIEEKVKNSEPIKNMEIFLFYLYLLIKENNDIVFFTYSKDFIKELYNNYIFKDKKNNIYHNFAMGIIIITLIDNYTREHNNSNNRDLLNIQTNLESIINDGISFINQKLNLNYTYEKIMDKNLDDIFLEILFSLLNSDTKKISINEIMSILKEMDYDSINIITDDKIYEKLKTFLKNKNFKNSYVIENLEDFNNNEKINIYYILLKYVVKDSIYIYQIPFLYEARQILLKNNKNNFDILLNNKAQNDKKKFIIEKLLDSEYYTNKYNLKIEENAYEELIETNKLIMKNFDENNNFDDMNEVMTYYENYCFETKQKEIEELKTALNKKEKVELDTKIVEEAKEMNLKYPLILYFYQKENKSESKPKTEEELKNHMTSYNLIEKGIKEKKIAKLKPTTVKIFFVFFLMEDNKEKLIKIFGNDSYDFFIKANKLKEVLLYYKNYRFETKKNEIKEIEKIIKSKNFNDNNYMNDFEEAKKINLRYFIVDPLYKKKYPDKQKSENEFNDIFDFWEKYIENKIHNRSTDFSELYRDKDIKNCLKEIIDKKTNEENLKNIFSDGEINSLHNIVNKRDDINLKETAVKTRIFNEADENNIINEMFKLDNNKEKIEKNKTSFKTIKDIIRDRRTTKLGKKLKTIAQQYFLENKDNKLLYNVFTEDDITWFLNLGKDKEKEKEKEKEIEKEKEPEKEQEKILDLIDKETEEKLNEVLSYYNNYEKNKEDIEIINEILKNKIKNEKIDKYLLLYNEAKEMNLRFPLIQIFITIKKEKEKRKNISINDDIIKSWKNVEKMIRDKKIKKWKDKTNFLEYFKDGKNKDIFLNVFTQDQYEYFIDIKNHEITKNNIINSKPEIDTKKYDDLKIILKYYKTFCLESKKEDIILLEKIIKEGNKDNIDLEKYLKEIDIDRYDIIEYIANCQTKRKNPKKETDFEKAKKSLMTVEKCIKDKKTKNMALKKIIYEYFIDEKNKDSLLKIFTEEEINHFIESNKAKETIPKEEIIQKEDAILNENMTKLNEVLTCYKNYEFESKSKDIEFLKNIIETKKGEYDVYLKEYDNAKIMNLRYPLVEFLIKLEKKRKKEDNIKNCYKSWIKYEDMIKAKKFKNMRYKKELLNYFKDEKNKDILLNIFDLEIYEYFKDERNHEKIKTQKKEKVEENAKKIEDNKKKLNENDKIKLNIVLNYYKFYLFESKKNEIVELESIISKDEENPNIEKYLPSDDLLNEYQIKIYEYPLVEIVYNVSHNKSNNPKHIKKEEDIKKSQEGFENIKKCIHKKSLKKMNLKIKEKFFVYFNNDENKASLLKIFSQEELDWFNEQNKTKKKNTISADKISELQEIYEYYKSFEKNKKEEIEELKNIIDKQQGNYQKFIDLNIIDKARSMNIRYPLINILFEERKKNKPKREEKVLEEAINSWKALEKMINDKLIKRMKINKDERSKLINYFKDENNRERLLKIFKPDSIDYFCIEENHKMKKENIISTNISKLTQENIITLEIYKTYLLNYYFESQKKEIKYIEDAIKQSVEIEPKKYEEKLPEYKTKNDRYPIVEYIYNYNNNNKKEKSEKEIQKILNEFLTLEKLIKAKNSDEIKKFSEEILIPLFPYVKENKNQEIISKIFNPEEITLLLEQEIISDENISKLKEVLEYYQKFFFRSKAHDINTLKEIIENKNGNYLQYLSLYDQALIANSKYEIINLFFDSSKKKEKDAQYALKQWEETEKMILQKKFNVIKYKKQLSNFIIDEHNKEKLYKLFPEEKKEFCKIFINKLELFRENNILKEILLYYKNYNPNSKQNEINLLENKINDDNNENRFDNQEILKDYNDALIWNKRFFIIKDLLGDNKENMTEKKILKGKQAIEKVISLIKDGKNNKIYEEYRIKILEPLKKKKLINI